MPRALTAEEFTYIAGIDAAAAQLANDISELYKYVVKIKSRTDPADSAFNSRWEDLADAIATYQARFTQLRDNSQASLDALTAAAADLPAP